MSQHEQSIRSHLTDKLRLPHDAVEYLCDMWCAIQFFDDVKDNDEVVGQDFDRALWSLLVKIPQNPFFLKNSYLLTGCVSLQVMKWHAANEAEAGGVQDEKSFMWRAGYYELVLMVAQICLGVDGVAGKESDILSLYGESYETYKAEFESV